MSLSVMAYHLKLRTCTASLLLTCARWKDQQHKPKRGTDLHLMNTAKTQLRHGPLKTFAAQKHCSLLR
jgi:hypothetical protein